MFSFVSPNEQIFLLNFPILAFSLAAQFKFHWSKWLTFFFTWATAFIKFLPLQLWVVGAQPWMSVYAPWHAFLLSDTLLDQNWSDNFCENSGIEHCHKCIHIVLPHLLWDGLLSFIVDVRPVGSSGLLVYCLSGWILPVSAFPVESKMLIAPEQWVISFWANLSWHKMY